MSTKIDALDYLLERARSFKMTTVELEEQRRSFAYGNTAIENDRITREVVDREAVKLKELPAAE